MRFPSLMLRLAPRRKAAWRCQILFARQVKMAWRLSSLAKEHNTPGWGWRSSDIPYLSKPYEDLTAFLPAWDAPGHCLVSWGLWMFFFMNYAD